MRSEYWLTLVAVLLSAGLVLGGIACNSGDDDDDTGDDDTAQAPNLPADHDSTANCISCHTNAHDGAYNNDTIPDKCLECHSAS